MCWETVVDHVLIPCCLPSWWSQVARHIGHMTDISKESCALPGTRRQAVRNFPSLGGETTRVGDDVRTVGLPAFNEEILQGRICARIVTSKELVHTVWAPLSGRVVDAKSALTLRNHRDAEMTARTWLVRIVPTDLEGELSNLKLC